MTTEHDTFRMLQRSDFNDLYTDLSRNAVNNRAEIEILNKHRWTAVEFEAELKKLYNYIYD